MTLLIYNHFLNFNNYFIIIMINIKKKEIKYNNI